MARILIKATLRRSYEQQQSASKQASIPTDALHLWKLVCMIVHALAEHQDVFEP